MAEATQQQIDDLKTVTDNIETTYQSLRRIAANLSVLLAAGRATCDEIKAYNLYALSVYNTQRGMLTQLRASGAEAPELPPYPTLFTWKGQTGENAWKIDCTAAGMAGAGMTLSDALRAAIAPTGPHTRYLSSNEIQIVTSDRNVFAPAGSVPTLPELAKMGAGLQGSGELGDLGFPVVLVIIIAAAAIAITAVIAYEISQWLTERDIQKETTERTKIQAQAFEQYTKARSDCYSSCMDQMHDTAKCTATCTALVDKPDIKIDSARGGSSSWLSTVGIIALAAGAGAVLFWYWRGSSHDSMPIAGARRRRRRVRATR